jgi:hypothetical protein
VPHVLDQREAYVCTPLRLTAWRRDARREHYERPRTPEASRAYLNTEDWHLGFRSTGVGS